MSPIFVRVLLTLVSVAVVGLLVLDQRRLGAMSPRKWFLAAILFGVLMHGAWAWEAA